MGEPSWNHRVFFSCQQYSHIYWESRSCDTKFWLKVSQSLVFSTSPASDQAVLFFSVEAGVDSDVKTNSQDCPCAPGTPNSEHSRVHAPWLDLLSVTTQQQPMQLIAAEFWMLKHSQSLWANPLHDLSFQASSFPACLCIYLFMYLFLLFCLLNHSFIHSFKFVISFIYLFSVISLGHTVTSTL